MRVPNEVGAVLVLALDVCQPCRGRPAGHLGEYLALK
jgi:hypothetical protein